MELSIFRSQSNKLISALFEPPIFNTRALTLRQLQLFAWLMYTITLISYRLNPHVLQLHNPCRSSAKKKKRFQSWNRYQPHAIEVLKLHARELACRRSAHRNPVAAYNTVITLVVGAWQCVICTQGS